MDVLITDVTEMQHGNYCVAGWNVAEQRMVRPLPGGNNWTAQLLAQHGVAAGTTIRAVPKGAPTGTYPHRTEDTPIDPSGVQSVNGMFLDWLGADAPPVADCLAVGFGETLKWNSVWDGVRRGVHVLPGTHCNSLVAVHVVDSDLSFCELFGKLKATFSDGTVRYQVAVSSRAIKEAWRKGGLRRV